MKVTKVQFVSSLKQWTVKNYFLVWHI